MPLPLVRERKGSRAGRRPPARPGSQAVHNNRPLVLIVRPSDDELRLAHAHREVRLLLNDLGVPILSL